MKTLKHYPPPGFKLHPTRVIEAYWSCNPPKFKKNIYTGARKAGIRYERQAQEYLLSLYPELYLPSPWFKYRLLNSNQWQWCQPDGLILDARKGRITICEIKNSHTVSAWWQIKKRYLPVVQEVFPINLWKFDFCEITRYYDHALYFPEPVELVRLPGESRNKFKIHIFTP